MEIPLEKATFTGHELQKKINKLFYMEILLQKATFTGHELRNKWSTTFFLTQRNIKKSGNKRFNNDVKRFGTCERIFSCPSTPLFMCGQLIIIYALRIIQKFDTNPGVGDTRGHGNKE